MAKKSMQTVERGPNSLLIKLLVFYLLPIIFAKDTLEPTCKENWEKVKFALFLTSPLICPSISTTICIQFQHDIGLRFY